MYAMNREGVPVGGTGTGVCTATPVYNPIPITTAAQLRDQLQIGVGPSLLVKVG